MATQASSVPAVVDVGRILDEGRWSGYQRWVVALTALSVVIDGVDSQLLGIAAPSIMRDWNVTRAQFAPLLAAGFIGMMVGGAIAGIVGDRWGRRIALIGSVLLFGVMTVAASMVNGLVALGLLRFFIGVGLQGASPNAAALVSEYVPLRNRAFAITATIVCIPLGAMTAGLIAIPVLPALGWRVLFAIGGVVSIAVAVMLMKFLPESPRYLGRHPDRWPELVRVLDRVGYRASAGAKFVDQTEVTINRAPLTAIFQSPADTVALWSAFFFCLLAVYSGFNWIPTMLTDAGLAAIANTGITAYNLGGVIGAVAGGLAIARFGSRPAMLGMCGGAVIGALVMRVTTFGTTSNTLQIIALLAVIGGFINAAQVTMYALGAHIYPSAVRATGVGTATSVGRFGAILSTYAGAWALDLGGSRSFFTLVAGAMLAVFVSLVLIRRHIPGSIRRTAGRASVAG
ncbi:MAG: MFS transporter [Blastocatellia bacterium]|nr:MAG: MFS transporter [Blastocatellia bacterium]